MALLIARRKRRGSPPWPSPWVHTIASMLSCPAHRDARSTAAVLAFPLLCAPLSSYLRPSAVSQSYQRTRGLFGLALSPLFRRRAHADASMSCSAFQSHLACLRMVGSHIHRRWWRTGFFSHTVLVHILRTSEQKVWAHRVRNSGVRVNSLHVYANQYSPFRVSCMTVMDVAHF